MSNKIHEKLINFRVYLDGKDQVGTADVQLPDLEAMTDTVKGAGIAGEIESPVLGHYGSLSLTLNWRAITEDTMILTQPKTHHLELRGAIQIKDAGSGTYSTQAQKYVVEAIPKKTGLGKLDVATAQESSSEFECTYLKIFIDGSEKLEIDKYNFICVIDGVDFLAETRTALGL